LTRSPEMEKYVGRKFETLFLQKKVLAYPDVEKLVLVSRNLGKVGFLKGIPGNISIRSRRGFIVTAGGVEKESLSKEDLVEVLGYDKKGEVVSVSGLKEPSSESRMHWRIYKEFPGVNAVVHVHDELVLQSKEKAKSQGLVFTEREFPYGTNELAEAVVNALRKAMYVVMVNHGSVAVGGSLEEAVGLTLSIHNDLLL